MVNNRSHKTGCFQPSSTHPSSEPVESLSGNWAAGANPAPFQTLS